MEVIGAGLGKTGTLSLKNALEILGYQTYHFLEHMKHISFWEKIYSGEIEEPDFAAEYAGVQAITDLPGAYFFQEFFEVFPDAKVVLTVRDSEDIWYKSLKQHLKTKQILPVWYGLLYPSMKYIKRLEERQRQYIYGSSEANPPFLVKKMYIQHMERVRSVVPADKLLVYNVKEGWEPLCKFLGKDIPSQPFPFFNKAGAIQSKMNDWKWQAYRKIGVVLACLVVAVSVLWSLFLN